MILKMKFLAKTKHFFVVFENENLWPRKLVYSIAIILGTVYRKVDLTFNLTTQCQFFYC